MTKSTASSPRRDGKGRTEDDPDYNPFSGTWEQHEQRGREVAALFDGEPMPLRINGLPPFPVPDLPGPYAAMVDAVSAALQVDTAMVGPMALGALSAACGGTVEAEVDHDWREVSVLHLVTVAEPSERKSPALKKIIEPLHAAEKGMAEAVAPRRTEALTRKRIADARAAHAEREAAKGKPRRSDDEAPSGDPYAGVDPVEYAAKLAAAADEIDVPELPRLLADDVTPEALNARLAANRGRLAVISAEGGMFGTLAGRYSRGMANLDAWLKGYAGDPIIVDRLGRVGEVIDCPALTVCLTVQNAVLAEVMADKRFRGFGLHARLAISQPRSMVGHRDPVQKVSVPEHVSAAYAAALTDLARRLHEREGDPAAVKFSPEARTEIADIERRVERRLTGDGDLSGDLEAWGGKHVGRVIRIALLLHMAAHGAAGADMLVSSETVGAAWRIGEFFAAHTRAAFGVADTGGVKLSDLTASFDYLRRCERVFPHSPLRLRETCGRGPKVLRRNSTRDPVLDMLADFNLIVIGRKDGARVIYVHPTAADLRWEAA
ncbi:YfjI family protein [Mycobacterium sp. 236(2023)]|uniref:YfjI family protein n=1 Tax=Mycobacterium sp. 236(2023) TaxID=3038163 RepID=UPI00241594CE|nr:YfjI family protein [Mycobacterium sp. 236(2023)]MDG4667819.1 YfjI family protein [Mycobacterium sp. 236(2023)]